MFHFPGYEPSFGFSDALYLFSIILSWCMLVFGLVSGSCLRGRSLRSMPKVVLIPSFIGMFYCLFFPWNIVVAWIIHATLFSAGETGKAAMGMAFTAACWLLTISAIFKPQKDIT